MVDLPGVGKNLQDHYYSFGVDFIADKSLKPYGETWTYRQEEVQTIPNILMNMLFGKGPMTSKNGLDAMGFIRTKFANKSEPFMPDFQMNFIAGCLTGGLYSDFKKFPLIIFKYRWWEINAKSSGNNRLYVRECVCTICQ